MPHTPPAPRVHLPGLVHRDPCPDWEPCAYSGKTYRLAKMLAGLGYEVFVYGGPDTATAGTDITVLTADDRARWFGDETWDNTVFDRFDPDSAPWKTMNARAAANIRDRLGPGDIIGLTMGSAQAAIAQAFTDHVIAEVGVGYEGIVDGTHRCYESEAWRHWLWGKHGVTDGRWYDTVIPNAYDPDELTFNADKGDYLLFLGRHIPRKGVDVVAELAKNHRVLSAGPGGPIPGVEYLGVVRGAEKTELLAQARAVLVPTQYIGPFEGVTVEAMLSGTPVITSPFGAFTETVCDGISGFRCHTLSEFQAAAGRVDDLDPKAVRQWAMDRYTLDVVAPQYDQWLRRLGTLYDKGWYS